MSAECYNLWNVILSGISIAATAFLSCVALWQNKRYKKLADKKDIQREKEIKEINRLKIRPYLFTTYEEASPEKMVKSKDIDFILIDSLSSEKLSYKNYNYLPQDIIDEYTHPNLLTKSIKLLNGINKYLLVIYNVKNVGMGSAVDISLKINDKITVPPFALMCKEEKTINILFDFDQIGKCDETEMILKFTFSDVEKNGNYSQESSFMIHEIPCDGERSGHYTSSYCETTEPQFD